ncbi:NAD(P)/FAD-dependent oxidoreductase [Halanaerobiaceae bacterium ANBcell28]
MVRLLFELTLKVNKLGEFNQAMVTKGGIDLKEINPKTMESKIVNNLFAVGEVLDIDGDTGGYNLQSAFPTAFLAGKTIRENLYNLVFCKSLKHIIFRMTKSDLTMFKLLNRFF